MKSDCLLLRNLLHFSFSFYGMNSTRIVKMSSESIVSFSCLISFSVDFLFCSALQLCFKELICHFFSTFSFVLLFESLLGSFLLGYWVLSYDFCCILECEGI